MVCNGNYISNEGEENLKRYKYTGRTDSIIYNNIMGPFAEFLVQNFVPEWVAPNILTLLSFQFNLVPHILLLVFAYTHPDEDVPAWLCIVTALGLFIYMNLDNMDGKQARRTRSSSPLGMLLDHGLDAISSWMLAISFLIIYKIPFNLIGFMIVLCSTFIPVFFLFWEEHVTGNIYFPAVNGVDEGLILMVGLIFWTAYASSSWWLNIIPGLGFQYNQLFAIFIILSSVFTLIASLAKVFKSCPSEEVFNEAKKLLSLVMTLISMALVIIFSTQNIIEEHLFLVIYYYGWTCTREVLRLLVSNCAHVSFCPYSLPNILSNIAILLNTFYPYILGKQNTYDTTFLYAGIAINFIIYMEYALSIIKQITKTLDIKMFQIKHTATSKKATAEAQLVKN